MLDNSGEGSAITKLLHSVLGCVFEGELTDNAPCLHTHVYMFLKGLFDICFCFALYLLHGAVSHDTWLPVKYKGMTS